MEKGKNRDRRGLQMENRQIDSPCRRSMLKEREIRAALWRMESKEHHGQGFYAENGYVSKYFLPPCA